MMNRVTLLMFGILAASFVVFAACDDEPTQAEANEQFCDDVSELIASLRVIRDLDADSTFEEVEDARERARNAYNAVLESREGVTEARFDDLEAAEQELQQALGDIDEDSTIGDALESVDDEIEAVALAAAQILNDVNCGRTGDSESQSEE
jgi:hypothetical protein